MQRKVCFLIVLGFLSLQCFTAFSAEPAQSEDAKRIVALVDKAAALVEGKGKDAFSELRKKDSEWWKGETYIFVDQMSGTSLVNPPDPSLEGKSFADLKDANGKPVVQEFIDTANTKGSGWIEYMWPKPGQTTPSKKMSYVKKAKMPDGELVIVGAGIYVK